MMLTSINGGGGGVGRFISQVEPKHKKRWPEEPETQEAVMFLGDGCVEDGGERELAVSEERLAHPATAAALAHPCGLEGSCLTLPRQSQEHSACIPHQSSTIGAVWKPASSLQRELAGAGSSSGCCLQRPTGEHSDTRSGRPTQQQRSSTCASCSVIHRFPLKAEVPKEHRFGAGMGQQFNWWATAGAGV